MTQKGKMGIANFLILTILFVNLGRISSVTNADRNISDIYIDSNIISDNNNIYTLNDFSQTKITDKGSTYRVKIDTQGTYEANIEYNVDVTLKVLSFANKVDRFHQITIQIYYVWDADSKYFPTIDLEDINYIGGESTSTIKVLFDDSLFESSSNKEITMEIYCYVKFKEGLNLGIDPTTEENIKMGETIYKKNDEQNSFLLNKQLLSLYTDKDSKLSLFIRTNRIWKSEQTYTILFTLYTDEFGEDIDRFHDIEVQFKFVYLDTSKEMNSCEKFEIGLYENYTLKGNYELNINDFVDTQNVDDINIELFYKISLKEGVCFDWSEPWEFWNDPKTNFDFQKAGDISLQRYQPLYLTGNQKKNILELNQQIDINYIAAKSIILDNANYYLNFTIYFIFEIIYHVHHTIFINSYYNKNEFNSFYYLELNKNIVDISVGVIANLGLIVNWENKNDGTYDNIEIKNIPIPSTEDIDGNGLGLEIGGEEIFLWDKPLTESYADSYSLGKISKLVNGIDIIPFKLNILEYLTEISPQIIIPEWLMSLNFRLCFRVFPYLYQTLDFIYFQGEKRLESISNNLLGFDDQDTTDNYIVDRFTKILLDPEQDTNNVKVVPKINTYAFSEINGLFDINLEILGLSIFNFPLINLFSKSLDGYSEEVFESNILQLNKSNISNSNWIFAIMVIIPIFVLIGFLVFLSKKSRPIRFY